MRGITIAAVLAALVGCATAPEPRPLPTATVGLEPVTTSANPAPPLPALPVSQVESDRDPRPRIATLEAVNEDIRTVVRGIADQYGLDYRLDPAVQGRVTTRLRNATLREVLDDVILRQGFAYQLQGNTLRVEPARVQTRVFTLDFIALSRVGLGTTVVQRRLGSTGGGGGTAGGGAGQGGAAGQGGVPGGGADVITSVTVTDLWEDLRVSLEAMVFENVRSPGEAGLEQTAARGATGFGGRAPQTTSRASEDGRRLIVNPTAGTIYVSAPPGILDEVEVFIQTFETAIQRQVRIEAKFVEVTLDDEFEFGINWRAVQSFGDFTFSVGRDQSGATEFTLAHGADNVSMLIDALDTQGDVQVLSSPSVSAMNNQRAIFSVTTDEVFFAVSRQPIIGPGGVAIGTESQIETQTIAIGIVLDVLAQISADNTITMNVRPMVTSLRGEATSPPLEGVSANAPIVDRRELDTLVRMRNGETHVIGGLIQTRTETRRSGVPILKDIPLLGRLFSRTMQVERRSELVIFITPTVVAGAAGAAQ